MTKQTKLALSVLSALLLAAPTLAQSSKPADTMKPESMMKAAPTFKFTPQASMNMMMSNSVTGIAAVPGEQLISRSIGGQQATLVYAGKNAQAIFAFYDKAIRAEGWKPTTMNGKMVDSMAAKGTDTMAQGTDTMAKPSDSMTRGTDTVARGTDSMAKPSDTMAKGTDTMAKTPSAMMGSTQSATFTQGGHSIDLAVRESAGRVTVTFKSK